MARIDREPFRCLPVAGQSFWTPGEPDERRTALREAAYIRRTRFVRGKLVHDFACRSEDLFMLTPIIPPEAPEWVKRPFLRWWRADKAAVKQSEAVAAWHICADLPPNMTKGRWADEVEVLVRDVLPTCAVAEICGHIPKDDPPHVHILVSPFWADRWQYGNPIEGLPNILQLEMKSRWLDWLEASKPEWVTKLKEAA